MVQSWVEEYKDGDKEFIRTMQPTGTTYLSQEDLDQIENEK